MGSKARRAQATTLEEGELRAAVARGMAALESEPGIEIERYSVRHGTNRGHFDKAEKALGRPLPKTLRDFSP